VSGSRNDDRPRPHLRFQLSSNADIIAAVEDVAIKRIVLIVFLILPLLIQSCSFEVPQETNETTSVSVARVGKTPGQPIDMDDDHRPAFVSPLSYFAAYAASGAPIPAERWTEGVDTPLRLDSRALYRRSTVLLI
jgi:hypothetical protein